MELYFDFSNLGLHEGERREVSRIQSSRIKIHRNLSFFFGDLLRYFCTQFTCANRYARNSFNPKELAHHLAIIRLIAHDYLQNFGKKKVFACCLLNATNAAYCTYKSLLFVFVSKFATQNPWSETRNQPCRSEPRSVLLFARYTVCRSCVLKLQFFFSAVNRARGI